jgi:pimeloyl-ACP methyl ester carboxylesterase
VTPNPDSWLFRGRPKALYVGAVRAPESKILDVDGRRITASSVGQGPLLFCVPGGPGLPGTHLEGLGGLDRHHTLLRPDWRGAGRSDPPLDNSHRVSDYVADLEEVRQLLGLDAFDLLGHSFGALVAVAYAAEFPGRVRRLVVDGPPDWRDRERIVNLALPAHFAVWDQDAQAYVEDLSRQWYWTAIEWFVSNEWREVDPVADMRRVTAETLVITGEHDPTFGEECARLLASYAPAGRHAVVHGAGHFTWFEQPERYVDLVAGFLREGIAESR